MESTINKRVGGMSRAPVLVLLCYTETTGSIPSQDKYFCKKTILVNLRPIPSNKFKRNINV